jgi:hypothetical protein
MKREYIHIYLLTNNKISILTIGRTIVSVKYDSKKQSLKIST